MVCVRLGALKKSRLGKAPSHVRSGVQGLAPSGNMRFRACIAFLSSGNPPAFVHGGSSEGIKRMQPPQNHVPTEPYGLALIIEWE